MTEYPCCEICGRVIADGLEEWDDSIDLVCFRDEKCYPQPKGTKVTNRSLPWPRSEYISIRPGDLEPSPPTPEQRIRVVAALATVMRDDGMTGGNGPMINAETLRTLLVCSDESWTREIRVIAKKFPNLAYDSENPDARFNQIHDALSRR